MVKAAEKLRGGGRKEGTSLSSARRSRETKKVDNEKDSPVDQNDEPTVQPPEFEKRGRGAHVFGEGGHVGAGRGRERREGQLPNQGERRGRETKTNLWSTPYCRQAKEGIRTNVQASSKTRDIP